MSKQVKISKLCLEIGGKKIELTMKQAKELKDVLVDTFGGEDTIIYRDRWRYPNTYPIYPNTWYTTCGKETGAAIGGNVMNAATDTLAVYSGDSIQGALTGNQVTLTVN